MKKVAWVALLLLALSAGAVRAQAPGAAPHASWFANSWAALVDLVEAILGANPAPTPPPNTTTSDTDCGSFIDPTGGCRH